MALSLDKRHEVALQFGVKKTGPTHVSDNRVTVDGFDYGSIEHALIAEFKTVALATDFLRSVGHLPTLAEEIVAIVSETTILNNVPIEPAPFCGFCTSRGVRHKKVCTRPQHATQA